MDELKYKRVLLKVSGEALGGEAGRGLDFDVIERVCDVVARCASEGVQVGIVVGGGKVAARKVEKLLLFGPALTVVAPVIEECMWIQRELLQKDAAASLLLEERAFVMEDLSGADFVVAATDDTVLNGQIAEYCRTERIPVNVVDDREKCTFSSGAGKERAPYRGDINRREKPGSSSLGETGDFRDIAGENR